MKLRFNLAFDDNPWPGPLGDREAVWGEAWLGPLGMLGLLENQLGLGGVEVKPTVRAAAMVPRVTMLDGFWTRSAQRDAFATCRMLLHWRDTLTMHGWRSQPVAERLEALARVCEEILPGVPDRLQDVIDALGRRRTEIEAVEVVDHEIEALPLLWQETLSALRETGVRIERTPMGPAERGGDLARCLERDFVPEGDGGLQLVRAAGPLAAAEQVAAWLAGQDSLDGIVVIGGDPLLDESLRRFGLPTTGAVDREAEWSVLQLLPLVLELGWTPQDPNIALDLLLAPNGPIHGKVSWRLAKALHEWPGLDNEAWEDALQEGLEKITDESSRRRARERIEVLLSGSVPERAFPVEELRARLAVMQQWLQGRRVRDEGAPVDWDAAISQCALLLRLVDVSGLNRLKRPQLLRLIRDATMDSPTRPRLGAEVGLHAVGTPAALAGPARNVIWWSFVRSGADGPQVLPLSRDELEALSEIGVRPPTAVEQVRELDATWQRPFQLTTGTLLLVCPATGEDGEEASPHPIWDRVAARLDDLALRRLVRNAPIGAERTRLLPALASPEIQETWQLPADVPVAPPEQISATGLEQLLACPLRFTLRYKGNLREGAAERLPGDVLLKGKIVHRVLEDVLARRRADPTLSPEQAKDLALEVLGRLGPGRAASLFGEGAERERAEVSQAIAATAYRMMSFLQDTGAMVVGIEEELRKEEGETVLWGRVDLRLSGPDLLVDFKWSGEKSRREELQQGSALQLAFYANLARTAESWPEAVYFIATRQTILSRNPLPAASATGGPLLSETWMAAERNVETRLRELGGGTVICATFSADDSDKPVPPGLAEDRLVLYPKCRYCPYDLICGRGGV